MSETCIEISDLVIRYGDATAVNGVSFTVGQGEHLTLLGPSGCGKTTTLRAIAGLEAPASGSIRVDGRAMFDGARGINVATEDRGVSMVFQSYAVWPHMTVFDNVAYGLRVRKQSREEIKARELAAVRQARAEAKEAARLEALAREEAALEAKRGERKERKALTKAEQKAKRDAKYAARKARK